MRSSIILASFIFFCFSSTAQSGALSAKHILDSAYRRASDQNKNVFVIFHASWCGWCHKMDNSMNDPLCKKFFEDNYVIVHLIVDESPSNKNLENPGAEEFRRKYDGDKAGLPFWLIMNKEGKLIADSQVRPEGAAPETSGSNIGCPASEEEVIEFIKILKNTSAITDKDLEIISERFKQNNEQVN